MDEQRRKRDPARFGRERRPEGQQVCNDDVGLLDIEDRHERARHDLRVLVRPQALVRAADDDRHLDETQAFSSSLLGVLHSG